MELSAAQLYRRLLRQVVPYWRVFLLALLGMTVLAGTEPALAALLKPMLDGSFVEKDPEVIRLVPFLLVGLFILRGLAAFAGEMGLAWVSSHVVLDLRRAIGDKLLSLPASYFDDNASGVLISRATYDVGQVMEASTEVLTVLVRDTLTIVGLLAWMLYLSWELTLIALVCGPAIIYLVRVIGRRLRTMSSRVQRSMGEMTQVLEEVIKGRHVLRIFGGQDYERRRFSDTCSRTRRYQMKFASAAAANVPIVQIVSAIAMAVIVYVASEQRTADSVTVGEFVSFFTAMVMLSTPMKRLTRVNAFLQKGLAAAESVFALLDQPSEPDEGTEKLDRALGRVEFHGVSFAYGTGQEPALHSVDLCVEPGQTVALVGPSGAGKSTLVNLIPRFYRPSAGAIRLDGRDIATLRLADLRRQIALVSQDVVLFNDTVRANIAYGPLAGESDARVEGAARAAHPGEVIGRMPQGLDTLIGENGLRLSGGQRQRIAIARAFLKDAPILILDEATASLDSASERHIQAALDELRRGRTTIVIAHRLATVENADRIVVLERGRIVEQGDHRSLVEANGLYASLYRTQFAAALG
jgi:subfamily B ATP-binding cassette protein MsbA